ncbi:MAG: hypothetical protein EHM36_06735 [Deltaproteobacteria bacterium]|nr:MAG: hypothetical protein EHM36_06735 [Deltaproteobacteria bacterium]
MIKWKRKGWIGLTAFLITGTLALLWGVVIQFHRDYHAIPPGYLVGNGPSCVEALKEEGFPFSFLVIGDTRGSETAETLIERALKKGKSSFMVILGDFVQKPDLWNHRFFLTEMTAEIKPPFPVFLVSGNHDIDFKESIKNPDRRMTPEIYESLYGERNFDFVFNQCLFIICGIDPRTPASYLNSLRARLSRKGKGKRHIFIFIHTPPRGLADYIDTSLPGEEEFFSLLEDFKDVTCFFGDYHGYWRGQRKGVHLLVSGGGGGHLKRSEWGEFHHLVRVTVGHGKASEEVITVPRQFELEDDFEEVVFTHLLPWVDHAGWVFYLLMGIFLLGSGVLFIKFLNSLRSG